MNTTQHTNAPGQAEAAEDLDPMAKVAADIAEADEKIRTARREAAAARRLAGIRHPYSAYTVVLWRDPNGYWRRAFHAKLTVPYPTYASLYVLLDFLLDSFGRVAEGHQLCAAAVAENPDTGRSLLAYDVI